MNLAVLTRKRRQKLFSRYDEGIQVDEEGWYRTIPESLAAQIARRFKGMSVVVDLYSGCGSSSIQLAKNGATVIGVEKNACRIKMASNNAQVYGVDHLIHFIMGDVQDVLPTFANYKHGIDGIFITAPRNNGDVTCSLHQGYSTYDFSELESVVRSAKRITENIAVLVPFTVVFGTIFQLFGSCKIQLVHANGKHRAMVIYFGKLKENSSSLSLEYIGPLKQGDSEMRRSKKRRSRFCRLSESASWTTSSARDNVINLTQVTASPWRYVNMHGQERNKRERERKKKTLYMRSLLLCNWWIPASSASEDQQKTNKWFEGRTWLPGSAHIHAQSSNTNIQHWINVPDVFQQAVEI